VLGARLGKSGGALAQQALVMAFGTIVTGAPVLAAMFAVVSVMWITSVINLGKEFRVKSAVMEQAAADNAARTHAALAQPAHLKHSKKH
jgi:ATP:ADP antiporter, AAA family